MRIVNDLILRRPKKLLWTLTAVRNSVEWAESFKSVLGPFFDPTSRTGRLKQLEKVNSPLHALLHYFPVSPPPPLPIGCWTECSLDWPWHLAHLFLIHGKLRTR